MLKESYPYYLANKAVQGKNYLEVADKYSGKTVSKVALADKETVKLAIAKAVSAAKGMRELPAYKRQAILHHCVNRFIERQEELAWSLCVEAGKPIKDSRGEVVRLIDTF